MWRASSGDPSSRRHGGRHVRFLEDNEDQRDHPDSSAASASVSAANSKSSRGRIHLPAVYQRTGRSHSKNRRPWYSLTVNNGTTVKDQQRQTTMELAAEEIERLLLDEANTSNANQMVDTTDDDYNDDYCYADEYDQEYQVMGARRSPAHLPVAQDHVRESGNGMTGSSFPNTTHHNQTPPSQSQALSHWPLRRRRSLPTLSRRSGSPANSQGSTPQSLDHPSRLARNTLTALVHPASSDELTEQDVNAYGLFDSAGADEARMRYQRHRQHQLQRRQQTDRGGSSCTSSSLLHTFVGGSLFPQDTGQTSGVIYDQKKYGPSIPFFTPILLALTTIFCVLVVVRLLVSLLTLAVGWLVVILLTVRLIHQIMHRPVHLIRLVHTRPLVSWTFIGALVGMAQVCCTRIALLFHKVTNLSMHHHQDHQDHEQWIDNSEQLHIHSQPQAIHDQSAQCFESPFYPLDTSPSVSFLFDMPGVQVLTITKPEEPSIVWNMTLFYTNFSNVFSMEQDLVLIWGMLEGIVYGIQVGILWHLLLGSSLHPSKLSQWIYTNLWCFARTHYRECIRHRQQTHLLQALRRRQQQELLYRRNSGKLSAPPTMILSTDDDKKQCMICLEEFTSTTNNNINNDNNHDNHEAQFPLSSLYRRYHLRCNHSFHFCCIQQWLEIKQSCPVCRISLLDSTDNRQELLFLSSHASSAIGLARGTPSGTTGI